MLRRLLLLLIAVPLLFMACAPDEEKESIYPVMLWEHWKLEQVELQIETDNPQVDQWATDVIHHYFSQSGLFAKMELTNDYDLWVMDVDSTMIRYKYQLSRDHFSVSSLPHPSSEEQATRDFIEGQLEYVPTFIFYTQHKKLHLHTEPLVFHDLLAQILTHSSEVNTEEELTELLEKTTIKHLSLDIIYQKYKEEK